MTNKSNYDLDSYKKLQRRHDAEKAKFIKGAEKEAHINNKAFTKAKEIRDKLEQARKEVQEILDQITGKAEQKLHNVPNNNKTVQTINKYIKLFKKEKDEESLKLLNGMRVIKEDELQLANGIIVKLGYPDIKADNKEIFENIVKNIEGKEIRAVYFKNKDKLKEYQEEMKQKGFRVAGRKDDEDGKIFQKEMNEIFSQFPGEGKGAGIWNTIILDILGRGFSGCCYTDGDFGDVGDEENFWSCSPCGADGAWQCCLIQDDDTPRFGTDNRDFGFDALFFQDKKSD
ncbi:hypothetical protein KAZ01_02600 [Candidatus Gracilibacteria bacterium]|nr:hypothetical protein [Candidatus Gracilibacteria bacterium]